MHICLLNICKNNNAIESVHQKNSNSFIIESRKSNFHNFLVFDPL